MKSTQDFMHLGKAFIVVPNCLNASRERWTIAESHCNWFEDDRKLVVVNFYSEMSVRKSLLERLIHEWQELEPPFWPTSLSSSKRFFWAHDIFLSRLSVFFSDHSATLSSFLLVQKLPLIAKKTKKYRRTGWTVFWCLL